MAVPQADKPQFGSTGTAGMHAYVLWEPIKPAVQRKKTKNYFLGARVEQGVGVEQGLQMEHGK